MARISSLGRCLGRIRIADGQSHLQSDVVGIDVRELLINAQILRVILKREWIVTQVVVDARDLAIGDCYSARIASLGRTTVQLLLDLQLLLVVREAGSGVRTPQISADSAQIN